MAVAWPAAASDCVLKQFFREQLADNRLTTTFDSGTDIYYKHTIANTRKINFGFIMNETEYAAFETFFITDIVEGALAFSFTNPRTGLSSNCKMLGEPTISLQSHNNIGVTFQAEQLP